MDGQSNKVLYKCLRSVDIGRIIRYSINNALCEEVPSHDSNLVYLLLIITGLGACNMKKLSETCVTGRKARKPNSVARERFSLRCYSASRVLLKITHIVEERAHCRGRSGRTLANAPKNSSDLRERQQLLYMYLAAHQVREDDIHPRKLPESDDLVIFIFVPDTKTDIERVRCQANSILGLNCYQEPYAVPPPQDFAEAI
jgi:hypothetical protein